MNGMEKEIMYISLDDIIPNRFQPRLTFDEQSLNELAKSIKLHGIIQPLVLRKVGNKFEIIAGERRFKASYIAGLTKVPAIVIDLNDNESAEVAIVENLQRRDLSPIEEAKSYKKLLDRGYLTQDQLATRMGKTQATISNKLRLLNLDSRVQDALLNGQISERHARSLLRLSDNEEQVKMLHKIIDNRMNVRDTEYEIERKLDPTLPELNNNSNMEILDNEKISSDTSEIPNINTNLEEIKEELIDPYLSISNNSENPIPFIRPIIEDEVPKIASINEEPENNINETIIPYTSKLNKSIEDVQDKVSALVHELNSLGFKVKLEEYDFQSEYQFVIKVDRN